MAEGEGQASSTQANTYASIRAEIAAALGVAESSTAVDDAYRDLAVSTREAAEAARMAEGQAIREDALANGRRVEEVRQIGEIETRSFTEYIPGTDGGIEDIRMRLGQEIVHEGIFSDTVERTTTYFDGMEKVGLVLSEITDGVETVIQVNQYRPGAIDLKPGDTRDIPADLKTAAGIAPSTWDPKADGSLGRSRPNQQPTPGQTGDSGPSSSSPSSSDTSDTSDTSSDSPSGPASGGGHPTDGGARPTNDSGPANENHGSREETGRSWTTATNDDSKWEGSHGESTTHTESTTTEYKNEDGTYTYETTTTTTDSKTGKTETEKATETTDQPKDDTSYVSDDGYSSIGPVPETNDGDAREFASRSGGGGGGDHLTRHSGEYGTFNGTLEHSREGNPHTVWGDYGDPADPNANPQTQEGAAPPTNDPLILVDPETAGDVATLSTDRHDFQTAIRGGDYVNPNDPLFGENTVVGGGNPNDTSPYEHDTGAMAHDPSLGDDDLP